MLGVLIAVCMTPVPAIVVWVGNALGWWGP